MQRDLDVVARAVPPAVRVHVGGLVVWSSGGWSLPGLAARLRTGCVFTPQPRDTFGLLVTRMRPQRGVQAVIHDAWADLAPSGLLLTGRTRGGARGNGGGHGRLGARVHLGWDGFAAAYRAELDARPARDRLEVLLQLAWWLKTSATVTLLSCERAPDGDEARVRSQRRVLGAWLLGELSEASSEG